MNPLLKMLYNLFSKPLHGKIIGMSEQSLLQTELEYFQKHKQEYLKLYRGQFVLIKGEVFAGTYTTEAEAYKAGLEKFGNTPFFIKQVLDNDESISYPAFFKISILHTLRFRQPIVRLIFPQLSAQTYLDNLSTANNSSH
jgi:hypothetical protein